MNEDYAIEQLEKTFKDHSEVFEREEKSRREKYPVYITPNFNISEAFHVICREINQLKEIINNIKDELS